MNYYITQGTEKSISWRQDAVEKTSTQQREPSGPRFISWGLDELEIRCGRNRLSSPGERERNADGHKSGGQYAAVLFGLQLPLTHNSFYQSERYIFLKNCVTRHYCVVVMILHADVYAHAYVLCGYTTKHIFCLKMNLAYKSWYAIKPKQPTTNQPTQRYIVYEYTCTHICIISVSVDYIYIYIYIF